MHFDVVVIGGGTAGVVAVGRDLTERRKFEAQLLQSQKLAALGVMAGGIAHEIRNPLASIRGSVEMLVGEVALEGYQQQLLDLVLKESARVNTIINDFLAYARLRPPAPKLIRAADLLEDVALQVRQHIGVHGGGDLRQGLTGDRPRATVHEVSLEQLADRPQAMCPVRKGHLAGSFQP